MGKAYAPPTTLSIHAQCFWVFTPTERRVLQEALNTYAMYKRTDKELRVAQMLREALAELSTQD